MDAPSAGIREAPQGEVHDLDDKRRQAQFVIPWETIDSYGTDFERRAFDAYLSKRLPVMCWQHDKRDPVGRITGWQKGQRAHEFVGTFSDFDAVPTAKRAWTQLKDGSVSDVSFGFRNARATPHPTVKGATRYVSAWMPEISPVTDGSIPGAMVSGVRAAQALDEFDLDLDFDEVIEQDLARRGPYVPQNRQPVNEARFWDWYRTASGPERELADRLNRMVGILEDPREAQQRRFAEVKRAAERARQKSVADRRAAELKAKEDRRAEVENWQRAHGWRV